MRLSRRRKCRKVDETEESLLSVRIQARDTKSGVRIFGKSRPLVVGKGEGGGVLVADLKREPRAEERS